MGKMAEVQRKLLEQMMGPEAMGIKQQNYDWWDDKVCRNFLLGTCPHLVFGNTKMDIGPCPKVHSDRILKQFQEAQAANPNDPRIAAFKQEHENNLYGFVDDCDRRIKMSQRKLEKTPEENRKTVDLMKEIGEIELSIQGGTEEIEALGEAGKVEESMEKLAAVEALKGLKGEKEKELQNLNETAGASGHQKLRVCETCGAMLSVLDSDKRLADHFGGKLHLGYHELRKLLSQFADERMAARQGGNGGGGPPSQYQGQGQGHNSMPAPSGPRGPPPSAPSGPSGPSFVPRSNQEPPQTPLHSQVPPADEMPAVGHGDKIKREAGELVEDVKVEKDRGDRYERERHGEDRERRHRHRDEDGERYERKDDRSSSRYEDRDRKDRSERSDRDRERDRDGHRGDRDRKHDDDRRRDRDRSRSPAKRRVL